MASLFTRALAGAGQAAAELGNKYVDDALARNRAQVLADIQRTSAMQTMKDTDAYQNDPSRLERMRGEKVKDIGAEAGARTAADIAGKKAVLTDPELTDLTINQANRVAEGTMETDAKKAGLMDRAKASNQAHVVNPGDKVIIGEGENTNLSAAQINAQLMREGLKDKGKEERQRYFESVVKSHNDDLKEISKQIADGIANGTLSPTAPPKKSTWMGMGPDKDVKDPAYEKYQALRKMQNQVSDKRDAVVTEWRRAQEGSDSSAPASSGGAPDPLQLRKSAKAGSEAALAGNGVVTPEQAAAAKAGMPGNTEYGADDAARSLDAINKEIAKHPAGSETRRILETERAKIVSSGKGQGSTTGPGNTPVPEAPPATVDRARDAAKQKVEATPVDENVPAARSPGARRDMGLVEKARQKQELERRDTVASADQLIAQKDARGLYDLQASAAWGYLTLEQKARAAAIIRGR